MIKNILLGIAIAGIIVSCGGGGDSSSGASNEGGDASKCNLSGEASTVCGYESIDIFNTVRSSSAYAQGLLRDDDFIGRYSDHKIISTDFVVRCVDYQFTENDLVNEEFFGGDAVSKHYIKSPVNDVNLCLELTYFPASKLYGRLTIIRAYNSN